MRGMTSLGACFLGMCLGGLVLAACTRPATSLVLVVDSDLTLVDRARIEVSATPLGAGRAPVARVFAPVPGVPGAITADVAFSLGIVPPDGDARQRVEIVVRAIDEAGAETVRRTVRTGFVSEQQLRLPVFLAAACLASSCGADETCGDDGSCVPVDVDPETLTPVSVPGSELPDGAAIDGSPGDAPTDAGVPRDVAIDALRPDAAPVLGSVPAPSSVVDFVSMRSVVASTSDPSTGTLVFLTTSGPTTATLSVREAGVTRDVITWTSRFGGVGPFQNLGTLVRAEGGVAWVCAALSGTLVTPEPVDVPIRAQPLLITSVDIATGATLWSSVVAEGVEEFSCDDLALLGDGTVLVAASKTGAGFGEADVIELDGVGLDPAHVGGRGLLPSGAGAGGHGITLRLQPGERRATLVHARHYAFSVRMRVEPILGGYAVSGLGGGASAWGTDDDTTGSGSFDVPSLATYALDGAAPDGERRIAGGSILPGGSTAEGVALEGTRTRLFVSGRVRGSGIERCAPGVADTSLPTTFVAEIDIATARCSANARWAQMNAGVGLQHWGEDNLFVLGSVSRLDTAQPVSFFGTPDLTFSQAQLPVLGAYSASLEPRWSLSLPTTPGTASIAFVGLHVLPSGRELWLHADLRAEAGELLGMPVTGEFWMRVAAP